MVKKKLKKLISATLVACFMITATVAPVYAESRTITGDVQNTLIKTDIETGEETLVEIPEVTKSRIVNAYKTSSYSPGVSTRSVIGEDNRQVIENTTAHPYFGIAYLSVAFTNGNTYRGTGYMVGKNVMLTAGHVLAEPSGRAETITAYFGRNGNNFPLTATAKTYYVDRNYTGSEAELDYGIIVFEENIGYTTGWFGMHASDAEDTMPTNEVTVTGYPADLGTKMYTATGNVTSVTTSRFGYDADTYGGNSGSPVYYYNPEYGYLAVGIHTHSGNSGLRIGTWLVNWLEEQGFVD